MNRYDTPVINELINQLGRLPGIGRKTAQRLAFHILSISRRSHGLCRGNSEGQGTCPALCCLLQSHRPGGLRFALTNRDETVVCVVENPWM